MLQQIRNEWTDLIQNELKAFAAEKGVEIPSQIQVGKPPKAEQGDFAYPMFTFAKAFGMNPAQIAGEIKKRLEVKDNLPAGEILTLGSDAHAPEHIAYNFKETGELLKACGFRYYTIFKERKPEFLKL